MFTVIKQNEDCWQEDDATIDLCITPQKSKSILTDKMHIRTYPDRNQVRSLKIRTMVCLLVVGIVGAVAICYLIISGIHSDQSIYSHPLFLGVGVALYLCLCCCNSLIFVSSKRSESVTCPVIGFLISGISFLGGISLVAYSDILGLPYLLIPVICCIIILVCIGCCRYALGLRSEYEYEKYEYYKYEWENKICKDQKFDYALSNFIRHYSRSPKNDHICDDIVSLIHHYYNQIS